MHHDEIEGPDAGALLASVAASLTRSVCKIPPPPRILNCTKFDINARHRNAPYCDGCAAALK